MIAKEDVPLFEKLGCDTVLDLALLIPKSFEDLRLYSTPKFGVKQLLEVEIKSVLNKPTLLRIDMFASNINKSISASIFHPKPYHYAQFKIGSRLKLFGSLEHGAWGITLTQPKIVTQVGVVIAQYGSTLRNDSHNRLVRSYMSKEHLHDLGLPDHVLTSLLSLHFPSTPTLYDSANISHDQSYALRFTECLSYMQRLHAKKVQHKAIRVHPIDHRPWSNSLPFTLTHDQLVAIDAIESDLKKSISAKRMIVGDVGAGKTMVILATAFMNSGATTILMAPTALLAIQLYEEALRFLPQLKSVLVTNKTSKKIDLNSYDFLIGTHALLFRPLPQATVVMIDEQHRFGTKQRNMIERLVSQSDSRPHVFQFSATPIPRTQAMMQSALIDVSLIQQTPFTKNITTRLIGKHDFPALLEHIRKEIALEHQVLIIYPLVEESETIEYQSLDEAQGYWKKNFEKVFVTHGKDKEKDQVLLAFRSEGNILLATTVVEVGISLPRLSTIVIVAAERLGFATLHQLRGRVSRTGLDGYCFLFSNYPNVKRLKEFSEVKSGFDIAALDLKYRNSGDMLSGKRQSGAQFLWFDVSSDEEIAKEVKRLLLKKQS